LEPARRHPAGREVAPASRMPATSQSLVGLEVVSRDPGDAVKGYRAWQKNLVDGERSGTISGGVPVLSSWPHPHFVRVLGIEIFASPMPLESRQMYRLGQSFVERSAAVLTALLATMRRFAAVQVNASAIGTGTQPLSRGKGARRGRRAGALAAR